jgi:hypothetical protein
LLTIALIAGAIIGACVGNAMSVSAVAIGLWAIGIRLLMTLGRLRERELADEPPADAVREAMINNATALMALAGPTVNVKTAMFLYEGAKARFERDISQHEKVEAKATTMLTLVGGASGAIGLFGFATGGHTILAGTTVVLAAIAAAIALIASVYVLRMKGTEAPRFDGFLSSAAIASDLRAGIALSLAQNYQERTDEFARKTRWDGEAMFAAGVAVVVAALLVLIGIGQASISNSTCTPMPTCTASPMPTASPTGSGHP